MNVTQLIALLQQCDPQALVILARDAEGTSFSPIARVSSGYYSASTVWHGTFYDEGGIWTNEDGKPAVCLDPLC